MDMEQITGFLPMIALFAVMYLFLIRPQMKKAKNEKKFASELTVGAKVITKSGVHGKITNMHDDGTCIIETGAGKIKFERSAISMEMSGKLNPTAVEKK